jgi:FMN phosphatase YigB (HAD superfamily)
MDRRIPVDVIFLDIDGVLLPFSSANKNQLLLPFFVLGTNGSLPGTETLISLHQEARGEPNLRLTTS